MNWSTYSTRKVVLGGCASLAIVGAWVLTHWLTIAGQYYGTMCTSLVALYATFCGANIAQDHILKTPAAPAKPAPAAKPRPPVEPLPEE